jgi:tetratricopeptide (TPR) repeat protein
VPQLEEFRRDLLEKAQTFYARFSELEPDSDELRLEIAAARVKLGDIYRLQQRTADAEREYRTGIAMLATQAQTSPDQPDVRQLLANASNWLGELLRPLDDRRADARAAYEEALRLQTQLQAEHPDVPAYRQELARTHYNLGILEAGGADPGDSHYREAIRLLEPLSARGLPSARQELARAFNNLGLLLMQRNRLAEARAYYEQAIEIHEQLAAADPDDREVQFELAKFYNNLGILLQENDALQLARQRSDQALRTFAALARTAPSLDMEMAHGHHLRGRILQGLGESAEEEYRTAVGMFEELTAQSAMAQLPEFQINFGDALFDLASWYWASDDAERAVEPLSQALQQHAAAPDARVRLAYDYALLVQVQLDLGRRAEARDALGRLSDLVPGLPEPTRTDLSVYYERLRSRM